MKTPEQIAAEQMRAWWERPDTTHASLVDMIAEEMHNGNGELHALLTAAALAALEEKENAR